MKTKTTKIQTIIAVFACFALAGMFAGCNNNVGSSGNIQSVTHTVTFNSNGGSTVQAQHVPHGQTATRPPANPTRSGYNFGNWYANASFTTVFNFATPITGDITLHARWTNRALCLYAGNTLITEWQLGPIETLDDAFDWIAGNALNNRTYRIVLGQDFEQPGRRELRDYTVNNSNNVTIILEGRGGERVIKNTVVAQELFSITGPAGCTRAITLILGNNITLQEGGVILGTSNKRLEMKDRSRVTGGRGIHLGRNATFIMHGGKITNNVNLATVVAGGVTLWERSRFEMNGGIISNNTGTSAGGL